MPDGEILDLTDEADEDHVEKLTMAQQAARGSRSATVTRSSATHHRERGPRRSDGVAWPVHPHRAAVGIEMQIGRRRIRRGVVRLAKDAQSAYNFARSAQIEVVALQPKAPFTGTEVMFKGYEDIWQTANTENHAFLPYNADPKAPGGKPERAPRPSRPPALPS